MEIVYKNEYINEQFLTPQQTQDKPIVFLKGLDTNTKYTLIMYDPNAVKGNFIHWLITNIHGNDFNSGKDLLTYKGPSPPKGTNIHNYIFSLYENDENNNVLVQLNDDDRIIELDNLLNMLFIKGNPIFKKSFTSKFVGGKRKLRKTIRRRKKIKRRTKRNKYL